jgi:hypothetical protein
MRHRVSAFNEKLIRAFSPPLRLSLQLANLYSQ